MSVYYRAIVDTDAVRDPNALPLCGSPLYFHRAERIERDRKPQIIPISEVPTSALERIIKVRAPIAGIPMTQPALMGILNVTPDSFSDGGAFLRPEDAVVQARELIAQGADIIDIGGESTRPGATLVPAEEEIARTIPIIDELRRSDISSPISIDTRKSGVAGAAIRSGALMLNDVSALTFDADYGSVAAHHDLPLCMMHAQGDPKTMQDDPQYEDVLLDVYDFLQERVEAALQLGIEPDRIILDPGIGFGKTQDDNMAILRRISLFHTLGHPILLGVSRKRFIGTIGGQPDAALRGPGSAAIGWWALSQGIQILRVHDIEAHRQMRALWDAIAQSK